MAKGYDSSHERSLSQAFRGLERSIQFLLATDVEGLFFTPVPREAVLAVQTRLTRPGCQELELDHWSAYTVASAIILFLEEIDGTLLTTQLHDLFMTATGIPTDLSRQYVVRMLILRLQAPNFSLVKGISLLLAKQCNFGKNWANFMKLATLFGPLLMKSGKTGVIVVHRPLTYIQAATRLVIMLIKDWNFLFLYGPFSSPAIEQYQSTLSKYTNMSKGYGLPRDSIIKREDLHDAETNSDMPRENDCSQNKLYSLGRDCSTLKAHVQPQSTCARVVWNKRNKLLQTRSSSDRLFRNFKSRLKVSSKKKCKLRETTRENVFQRLLPLLQVPPKQCAEKLQNICVRNLILDLKRDIFCGSTNGTMLKHFSSDCIKTCLDICSKQGLNAVVSRTTSCKDNETFYEVDHSLKQTLNESTTGIGSSSALFHDNGCINGAEIIDGSPVKTEFTCQSFKIESKVGNENGNISGQELPNAEYVVMLDSVSAKKDLVCQSPKIELSAGNGNSILGHDVPKVDHAGDHNNSLAERDFGCQNPKIESTAGNGNGGISGHVLAITNYVVMPDSVPDERDLTGERSTTVSMKQNGSGNISGQYLPNADYVALSDRAKACRRNSSSYVNDKLDLSKIDAKQYSRGKVLKSPRSKQIEELQCKLFSQLSYPKAPLEHPIYTQKSIEDFLSSSKHLQDSYANQTEALLESKLEGFHKESSVLQMSSENSAKGLSAVDPGAQKFCLPLHGLLSSPPTVTSSNTCLSCAPPLPLPPGPTPRSVQTPPPPPPPPPPPTSSPFKQMNAPLPAQRSHPPPPPVPPPPFLVPKAIALPPSASLVVPQSNNDKDIFLDISGKIPKMKQLVWRKITGPLAEKSVWANTGLDSVNVDFEQLESLFSLNSLHTVDSSVKAEQDLKMLDCACDQLLCNTNFVKLLEAVLAIGNYLNGGTCRGAAKGFKLDALLKLMDIKDSNKKTTLLHFVVSELLKANDQILYLSEELKGVKVASSLNLDNVNANISDLECGMDTIKEEVHLATEDPGQDPMFKEHFLQLVVPFYEQATMDMDKLKSLSNATFDKLKDVSVYFGEPMETKGQIDLFRTMREFLHMFDIVCKEIREARKEGKNTTLLESKTVLLRPLTKQPDRKESSHRTSSKQNILSHLPETEFNPSENLRQTQEDKTKSLEDTKNKSAVENCPNTSLPAGPVMDLANKLITQTQKLMLQKSPRIGYDSDWSTGTG